MSERRRETVRVAVTGAAGQVAYALLFQIASGGLFGPETDVELALVDLESAQARLAGVAMELEDCAFARLRAVRTAFDPEAGFEGCHWALLLGAMPRREGMERGDLLKVNARIFVDQGRALDAAADPSCRVLVVGNPCNTNAWIARSVCRRLPPDRFAALTMLDQNRAAAWLARRAGCPADAVRNVVIWGNHSGTQYPDVRFATVQGRPAVNVIAGWPAWRGEMTGCVRGRGAEIIRARGVSSAASAARAVADTLQRLIRPTPEGEFFSLAVPSDGSYEIPPGVQFSFPVRSDGRTWRIVQGLPVDEHSLRELRSTLEELEQERAAVEPLLRD